MNGLVSPPLRLEVAALRAPVVFVLLGCFLPGFTPVAAAGGRVLEGRRVLAAPGVARGDGVAAPHGTPASAQGPRRTLSFLEASINLPPPEKLYESTKTTNLKIR